MNPASESEAIKLAKASDSAGVVICPPFAFLSSVGKVIKKATLGAQDLFWQESGPFTGEVSAGELKSEGVKYVIIGHSERRAMGETDEIVAKKVAAAISRSLTPVICIGEQRSDHDKSNAQEVVSRQLRAALSLIPADIGEQKPTAYIAYEPVWAISSNQVGDPVAATVENAISVVNYLKGTIRGAPIKPLFLYGGSVDSVNLAGFLSAEEIEGALVGSASLKPAEFKKMALIAKK